MSSATHCGIVVPCALNLALFELFQTVGLCVIDDILLGPHFVTHVPWAGTFLKDYVLHIIYVIYSTTHIYAIYSVTCICAIYGTT